MAIQIRNIGANGNVVSASLSASVSESPARLSITTLGDRGAASSAPGIQFVGTLVSRSTTRQQGRNLTTSEYIDGSIKLDQNCIVLFRRGIGGSREKDIAVKKRIVVPYLEVSGGNNGVTFNFASKLYDTTVLRKGGFGAGGLGQEEWAPNPCDASNVTYKAGDALSIIGAPRPFSSSFRCAYEGTYRSVLSSIYTDCGVGYWWDWRGGGIRVVNSGGIGFSAPREGCGILSSTDGETRIGTTSQSSWAFERWQPERQFDSNYTVTSNTHLISSPIRHPKYPSTKQILSSLFPFMNMWYALKENNLYNVGYQRLARIGFSTGGLTYEYKAYLQNKYGFDPDNSLDSSVLKYLNIPAYSDGDFYLAKSIQNKSDDDTVMELYYPFDPDNYQADYSSFSQNNSTFTFKKVDISYNPEPTMRGNNVFANTFEDERGIVRKGYWRSVQPYVEGNDEETIAAYASSMEGAITEVPHDIICDLIDARVLPEGDAAVIPSDPSLAGNDGKFASTGLLLRNLIETNGYKIIFVDWDRANLIGLSEAGAQTNANDLAEAKFYEDPNAILEAPPPPDKPEWENDCVDVYTLLSSENSSGGGGNSVYNNNILNGPELKPGLSSANGITYYISRGFAEPIKIVMPSTADYYIVRTVNVEYSASARTGSKYASNTWYKSGGLGSNALSHSVSISDVTPDDGEAVSKFDIPARLSSPAWLRTLEVEADGFYMPIVPGLESLSANLSSNGLRVSYSYKEIPPKPKNVRMTTSVRRNNVTVALS